MQANQFKEFRTEEDMKLGFEQGFDTVVEHWRSLFGRTARYSIDPSSA